jgi:hypothetical protein
MEKYDTLPDPPDEVSASFVIVRIIDGLGFRYNCATEGLQKNDIYYTPPHNCKTIFETGKHIYDLFIFIANAFGLKTDNYESGNTFEEIRKTTLTIISDISNALKNFSSTDLAELKMQLHQNNKEYSFWFLLNGPIADALTHIGQINMLRRMSGNPVRNYSPFKGIKYGNA